MSDVWYYAACNNSVGPLSKATLIEALSQMQEPKNALVWRSGFADWKKVSEISELFPYVAKPPPLPPPLPPLAAPKFTGEPSVSAADAAQFKNLKPDLTGIAGWLIIVAIGQVLGPLRLLVSLGEYYEKMDKRIVESFPIAVWGEAALNAFIFLFVVYTAVLFFRHSRKFPTFFVWQWLVIIALPFIDAAWIAISMAGSTGRAPAEFMNLEPKDIGQSIAYAIVGGIWVAYILKSKRVANTFVK